ncbi:hypothetical protein PRK78_004332 [Emydomyces testavorans]|uniref:Uncharacterized protein n=1 Tax=Emydomyces testavorans TaxID=2070801 RepID=A0AAF0DIJ6_9EURO|nr:hypothetical protein PRK78_004332 [Emydomyces testavorans]
MPLSPYRQTNTALRLSKPSDQWKLALQEIKILLLRRRYKQCAAISHELIKNLDGNLHAIHKAYLQYYGAASYETLGRAAHNYSSNKLPLLNLARDGYAACKISLEDALKELEESDSEFGDTGSGDESENARYNLTVGGEESFLSVSENLGTKTPKCVHAVFNLMEPWRTYSRYNKQSIAENTGDFTDANRKGTFDFDLEPPENDDIQAIEANSSELMPPPLRIQKIRNKTPTPSEISIPDRSLLLPLPLFSPSPLSPRKTTTPQTPPRPPKSHLRTAESPTTRFKSRIPIPVDLTPTKTPRYPAQSAQKPRPQPSARMLSILTSLPIQLNTNISNLSLLISQTAELQHLHKATKSRRFASFWSFTPVFPDHYDSSHNNSENKALPNGTSGANRRSVSNGSETKPERIARLRSAGWNTVGIRDPMRGWKGSKYYEDFCEEVLGELYGY